MEETGGKIFRSNGKPLRDVRIAFVAGPADTEVENRNERWTFSAENVSGVRNLGPLDTFGRMELDSEAKAVSSLASHTRKRAWLRFSSDPWHLFGGLSPVFLGTDLTPLERFLF